MIQIIKSKKLILLLVAFALILLLSPVDCYAKDTVNFVYSKGVKDKTSQTNLDKAAAGVRKIYSTYATELGSFNDFTFNIITVTECKKKKLGCENDDTSSLWGAMATDFKFIVYDYFINGVDNTNAHEIFHGFNPGSDQNRSNSFDVALTDNRTWDELFTGYYTDEYFPKDEHCNTTSHLSDYYYFDKPATFSYSTQSNAPAIFRIENDTSTKTDNLNSFFCAYDNVRPVLPKIFEILRLLGVSDPVAYVRNAAYTGKLSTIDKLVSPYNAKFMYNIGSVLNPYWDETSTGDKNFMQNKNDLRKALAYISSVKQKIIAAGVKIPFYSNTRTVPTERKATISWSTQAETNDTYVYVYSDKNITKLENTYRLQDKTGSKTHNFVLDGLTPGTAYWYRLSTKTLQIAASGEKTSVDNLSGIMNFTTIAAPAELERPVKDDGEEVQEDTEEVQDRASLTADGKDSDFSYNKNTSSTKNISIVGTFTPDDLTGDYTANFRVSSSAYPDKKPNALDNDENTRVLASFNAKNSEKTETYEADWSVSSAPTGYYLVTFIVSSKLDNSSYAKKYLWIKITEGETVADPTDSDPQTLPGSAIIEKSSDVASAGGDPVTIKTYLSGKFENAAMIYNLYISTQASASEPTAPVTDTNVWADKSPSGNGFILTSDEISEGINSYVLPEAAWQVDPINTVIGKHYVKAVITDAAGSVVAEKVTIIDVVKDGVAVTLKANDTGYVEKYDMTTETAPINITVEMTPTDPSISYSATLYISEHGYISNIGSHTDETGAMVEKNVWPNLSGTTNKTYSWSVAPTGSEVGNHEVAIKVYDLSTSPSKLIGSKSMWIKLCKGSNCGTSVAPTEGDKSTLKLEGALAEAGIKVDFKSYASVVKFIKDTWFPIIIGMFAFFGIIYSGWMYIMSAGDQVKADKGKKGLLYSVIGIAIAVLAQVIIKVSESMIDKFSGATSVVGSNSIFTKVTDQIAIISGMLAFIYLIYSGILYLTAAGNPDNSKKGLQGVINAAIGIVIIVTAWAIIGAVTGTLGSYFK